MVASPSAHARRVVVTGLGLVTPLGVGVGHNWMSLLARKCGLRAIAERPKLFESVAAPGLPCKVAAFVPESTTESTSDGLFDATVFSPHEWKTMSRATAFALLAADEALRHAGWQSPEDANERDRTGVAIGVGIADLEEVHRTGLALSTPGGYKRISPYFVPRILTNMAAGNVSIRYGFRGPNHAVSTACTTGAHAIGDAATFIRNGRADVMVCGAAEACIGPISIAGFSRMRALSTKFNETPERASRPFDAQRDGFVMGEGAGVLVLEELEHARRRQRAGKGVRIVGEVCGYGLSGDAFHLSSPPERGDSGAFLSMQRALSDAGVELADIGHINCHATSTPLGDRVEFEAILRCLRASGEVPSILISSAKGAIGHLLGAAGAVEAIFTLLACEQGVVPPTLNFESSDMDFTAAGVKLVAGDAQPWSPRRRRIALKNSFGFGGTNATLCLANFFDDD